MSSYLKVLNATEFITMLSLALILNMVPAYDTELSNFVVSILFATGAKLGAAVGVSVGRADGT